MGIQQYFELIKLEIGEQNILADPMIELALNWADGTIAEMRRGGLEPTEDQLIALGLHCGLSWDKVTHWIASQREKIVEEI
jgi:hypothetical protein